MFISYFHAKMLTKLTVSNFKKKNYNQNGTTHTAASKTASSLDVVILIHLKYQVKTMPYCRHIVGPQSDTRSQDRDDEE